MAYVVKVPVEKVEEALLEAAQNGHRLISVHEYMGFTDEDVEEMKKPIPPHDGRSVRVGTDYTPRFMRDLYFEPASMEPPPRYDSEGNLFVRVVKT